MVVYISGPITGQPNENKEAFKEAEKKLIKKGHFAINPHDLNHKKGSKWGDYMRKDLQAMLNCDAVYMLKGHEKSAGANIELALAQMLGMGVIYA